MVQIRDNTKTQKTETEERFEEVLKRLEETLDDGKMTFRDGRLLVDISHNLLLRYLEIKESRDNWRSKYYNLKNEM